MDVLQVDGLAGRTMYRGVSDCIRQTYSSGGIGAFFPGLSTTLIRTFPVNAITFSVVTWILRYASDDASAADTSVTYQSVEETMSHLAIGASTASASSAIDFHPGVALKVEWNSFRLRIPDTDIRLQLDLETQPLSTPPWNTSDISVNNYFIVIIILFQIFGHFFFPDWFTFHLFQQHKKKNLIIIFKWVNIASGSLPDSIKSCAIAQIWLMATPHRP